LITEQHKSVKAAWEFYTRAPCNAPMYEIDDSIRDTAHSLSAAAKFSNKMPLVIIADTGSGEEDLFGIKQGRIHGLDFIVVDHHRFDEDFITAETLVHINPFLVGEDGAKYSAGMICTELARFINNKDINVEQIPAMAGMADHIDNPHVMDAYLKIASKKGYNKELLNDIATVIDFVSSKLRFMEAREYIEVLFGEPMEKQKELVKLMSPYIRELEAKGLDIARKTSTQEKVGKTNLVKIYVEQSFSRGTYPKTGKCVSMLHDDVQKSHNLTNVVTIGILPDAITMRATDEANFSVQELIHHLNEKLPHAFVEGGGHKNAGSIKFAPFMQEKILHEFKEFVKKR
jgi:archaea-specific RecJ-like exonuclease